MRLIIVSGTSGAGKSVVLHTLEDLGFYCIDNLPMGLLPAFARELTQGGAQPYEEAAIGIDARNLANDLNTYPEVLKQLHAAGIQCQTLFLDADDRTLLKRFSETRRRHPLSRDEVPLVEAIRRERQQLEPIASRADLRIDTTHTNLYQLRDRVKEQFELAAKEGLSVLFESFGFKHGVPVDADFVFDVRCLPNPYWEAQLRGLTGRDEEVVQFLEQQPEVERMFTSIRTFLEQWLPQFEGDNRSYMTVAIGCTGGQHRSVYFTERLARHFQRDKLQVFTRHRELS